MNLVIVESPTKARKLRSYLGSDFHVEASVGHVRDLPKSTLGVDLEHDFEPVYEVSEDKQKVVKELQKQAKSAEAIYLATDPDREGEAIAWHIKYLLSHNSKSKKTEFHRATFHEITKPAVLAAIQKPSKINKDLVDAQQARRVVDRLVGYKLSPILWKKIRRGLSAGRVQSVALRLIAEREKEIAAFIPEEYWEVDVLLNSKFEELDSKKIKSFKVKKETGTVSFENIHKDMFVARVIEVNKKKYEPTKEDHVTGVTEFLEKANYVIHSIDRKERQRASLPPFTTSTLQQAAANRLGFTSKQTMTLAQQLYEEGLITYHRTDSVSLSQDSIAMARGYIQERFGDKYLPESPRYFSTKTKNAQEAHEAIRVTNVKVHHAEPGNHLQGMSDAHKKLYDLIWRRFIATQMSSAVYDQTTVLVNSNLPSGGSNSKFQIKEALLRTSGSVLKFDGWMKLFPNQGDTILPNMEQGQKVDYIDLNAAQKFTLPPPRFNDASLVKTLEEKGIGRPSTYASIISVIVDRGYVERKDKRFFATAVGITVSDFLVKNFSQIMDYDFTAEMEEDLDRISRGEKEWKKVIKEFFTPFDKKREQVEEKAERVQIPVEETGESCPKCGATEKGKVVIRTGRFGKFRSCSRFPDCDYTENIVEKLDGMKCPLCKEGEVIIKNSRWGKSFYGCSRYPECDWASWKKPEPGYKLTQAQWKVMQEERKARAEARKAGKQIKTDKKQIKTDKKRIKTKSKN